MTKDANVPATSKDQVDTRPLLTCGIIAPIAATDGCTAEHWLQVKEIFIEAISSITELRFSEARLVSERDEIAVIHKSIVQALYNNDIVICDMSCRNPNVMFELGMRLAFNKPTVLVIDDKTDYAFDTGVLTHIKYPRDLHYQTIKAFKKNLANAVTHTYMASLKTDYASFLSNFGEITPSKLDIKEGSFTEVLLEKMDELQREIIRIGSPRGSKIVFTTQEPESLLTRREVKATVRALLQANKDVVSDPTKPVSFSLLNQVGRLLGLDPNKPEDINPLIIYINESLRELQNEKINLKKGLLEPFTVNDSIKKK